MNTLERGTKHVCPDCATKYYDLMRTEIACPNCGAKPRPTKIRRAAAQTKKTPGARPFVRYR